MSEEIVEGAPQFGEYPFLLEFIAESGASEQVGGFQSVRIRLPEGDPEGGPATIILEKGVITEGFAQWLETPIADRLDSLPGSVIAIEGGQEAHRFVFTGGTCGEPQLGEEGRRGLVNVEAFDLQVESCTRVG